MSERKVLTKYYPPDFDPSKITRTPKHLRPTGPKLMTVRLMAPFGMKCTACGEYIYKGRKFNARKETTDEKYLNIAIFRFYIRCTRCSSEITFKTDPKNMDYTCERGAKRNFEPWRDPSGSELQETDEERLDRLQREQDEEAEMEERNAMEELEEKTKEARREMQIADKLDEIRMRNARIEKGERGEKEEGALTKVRDEVEEARLRAEREDEEAARRAFEKTNVEKVRRGEAELFNGQAGRNINDGMNDQEAMPAPPLPLFERAQKAKKPPAMALGVVKKTEPLKLVAKPTPPAMALGVVKKTEPLKLVAKAASTSVGLGLGDYDSESD
jgi:Saf4/Yju2 protein